MCEIILISHKTTRLLLFCQEKFLRNWVQMRSPVWILKACLRKIISSYRAIMQILIGGNNLLIFNR